MWLSIRLAHNVASPSGPNDGAATAGTAPVADATEAAVSADNTNDKLRRSDLVTTASLVDQAKGRLSPNLRSIGKLPTSPFAGQPHAARACQPRQGVRRRRPCWPR